ncbi:MAG: HipA family kinase [Acidobacteriaceae bacterium]
MNVEIDALIRSLKGKSESWLMRGSNKRYYFVKFHGNLKAPYIAFNELVASALGRKLNLPIPNATVVNIPRCFTEPPPESHPISKLAPVGERLQYSGFHVGIEPAAQPDTPIFDYLPTSKLKSVVNLWEAAGALVFDKWVCNTGVRQFVYSPCDQGGYRLTMIDQSCSFGGASSVFWDFQALGVYPDRCLYSNIVNLDSFEPWLSDIESISEVEIAECFESVPREWRESAPGRTSQIIRELLKRRDSVREMISKTLRTLEVAQSRLHRDRIRSDEREITSI